MVAESTKKLHNDLNRQFVHIPLGGQYTLLHMQLHNSKSKSTHILASHQGALWDTHKQTQFMQRSFWN